MGFLEDMSRAFDPNQNGVAKAFDPNQNGAAKAFDPNKNGIAAILSPTHIIQWNQDVKLADAFDPEKNRFNASGNGSE